MKEKTPAPPEKAASSRTDIPAPEGEGREEDALSPRIAGFVLIAAGILLMLLSGWAPMPIGLGVWENVSSEGSSVESSAAKRPCFASGLHDHAPICRGNGGGAKLYGLREDPERQNDIAWRKREVADRMYDEYILGAAGGEMPSYDA